MVLFIFSALILIVILYTILPFLLSFGFHFKVLRQGSDPHKMALTFDDGPHPVYTPILLDLLKEHQVKATFFVVGSRAEKYPELIIRMKEEGHLIGIHNYIHRSNWLMFPWTVREGINRTAKILENLTGDRSVYYRPPWGLLNLGDFFLLNPYRIILWSVMAEDWKSTGGSDKIKRKLLAKVSGGSVVLLHDCGDTPGADQDAPQNTIHALKDVIPIIMERGYQFVRIDEWK
ncbi:polysaccharide deacetylase family protein [Bacillus sp. BRMEA1]|uniref:polysaccharide deacetylase family protein n=1 Tax=Neobacillus endophyticus TaxID=2738405 RepID=UPI001563441D|nr:polysaccharide deacetylase family protein [Neobacillus endophyticus]NRD79298.1 polysaccharide deacetylase family protein [Neobacillus endophyticus]